MFHGGHIWLSMPKGDQKLGKSHDDLPVLSAPAPARPPDGYKVVGSEWKYIRSSIPREVLKDPKKGYKRNAATISQHFQFYVRAGEHLRDYDPAPKEYPGTLIGTTAIFCRRTYKTENGVTTEVEDSEVAVDPYYTPDKKSRVALRVSLGDKYNARDEKVQAKFYLSAVLGWAYNTTFAGTFDEFVAQGWQGDHLVDLESDNLEAPERALFFLFIWARARTVRCIECARAI